MQFNDGSEDVPTGDHIEFNDQDLGTATYDADDDGVADSVIIGQEDMTLLFTDEDGDGEAEGVRAFDGEGNEVDPRTGAPVEPQGDSSPGEDSGDTGPGTEQVGTDPGEEVGTTTTGDDSGGPGGTDPGESSDDPTGTSTAGSTPAGEITVVADDGSTVPLGPPTADMDNDGVPDTAVVKADDGTTTGFTDRDGDGQADQMTRIDGQGNVTIAVVDDDGKWQVEVTGKIDESGTFVPDSGSPANDGTETGSSDASTTADADYDESAEPASAEITFTAADGQVYPLGAPTADLSGDGVPDTVLAQMPDGTVVGYSDVDGDGQADQVTQIDPDGSVVIGVPDGQGGWEQAVTGRIGDHGEFVPDATAPVGPVTA